MRRATMSWRSLRTWCNLGDVIVDGDRLHGDGVNIAARLQSLAEGGGIFLSGTAYDQVEGKLPLAAELKGEQTVKNIALSPLGHAYYLAILLSELGRAKEAQEAWNKASDLSPAASLSNLRERMPYKRASDLERFLAAAHRAGMQ